MSRGGEKILRGLREALAHASGRATAARMHIVHVPNVKAIRRNLKCHSANLPPPTCTPSRASPDNSCATDRRVSKP